MKELSIEGASCIKITHKNTVISIHLDLDLDGCHDYKTVKISQILRNQVNIGMFACAFHNALNFQMKLL